MSDIILDVKNLKKYFQTPKGLLHAVDDVTFSIEKGKTIGIVGESGCGKSTTGRSILRLIEPTSGEVHFAGKDILRLGKTEMQKARQDMQIIFQDPFSSLDPRVTVSKAIEEPLRLHRLCRSNAEYRDKVREIMDTVGLAERLSDSYPHELDGGRRQRVGIGRALALNPKFIVCDEPVSALDVSIQAQILNLLCELQEDRGLTYAFITHNLAVVNYISDEIIVMYLGKIVEKASSEELFTNPVHPYTKALLSAIPEPNIHNRRQRIVLEGEVASPVNPPVACRFCSRCPYATERCRNEIPELKKISSNHQVACFLQAESNYA
ncbi:MAG: ATP-binding cassette domain-containing protein [Spirochaetales bacterium]|nr:ATP-binding cassette domain-containing protein [Spirochaetales bacterium]